MNYNLNYIAIGYKCEDPYSDMTIAFKSTNQDDALSFLRTIDEKQFKVMVVEFVENRMIHSGSIDPLDYQVDEIDKYDDAIEYLQNLTE